MNRTSRRYLRKNAERFADEMILARPMVSGDGSIITDRAALALLRDAAVRVLKAAGRGFVFMEVPANAADGFNLKPTALPATLAAGIDVEGCFTWTCRPGRYGDLVVAIELAALCSRPGHPALWGEIASHA